MPFLSVNSEPLLLAHHAVPMAGGILTTVNIRFTASEIAGIVAQSGATRLFYSPEFGDRLDSIPRSVERFDTSGELETFLETGVDEEVESWLGDEDDVISLNYTSGTTGRSKGVMYHHRGAYLTAVSVALEHGLTANSSYLWTLPMFHCNGWTYPWALAAVGARSVCIPAIDPAGGLAPAR